MSFLGKILNKIKKGIQNPDLATEYLKTYLTKLFTKYFFKKFYPACKTAMEGTVILSDGSVTTCCIDALGQNKYGDIYTQTFADIWNNNFQKFRKKNLYDSKLCFSCIGSKTCLSPGFISNSEERKNWESKNIPFPKILVLEISGICNYACEGCFSNELNRYRSPFFNLDLAKSNLIALLQKIERLRLYNWGEPLLNKNFCEILHWIKQISPSLLIDIATNGIFLNEDNIKAIVDCDVSKVIVSVHGGPGTENMLRYSKKNANYEKVLNNVSNLIKYRDLNGKKHPIVSLKAILFYWNDSDEDMERLRQDGRKIKVDRVFWVLDRESGLTTTASKRFKRKSKELKMFVEKGEVDRFSE